MKKNPYTPKKISLCYSDLQNNCIFDCPLKNASMRGIPIKGPFFLQLCSRNLKKGPKIVSQRAVKFAIILQVAVYNEDLFNNDNKVNKYTRVYVPAVEFLL
jgi:hypothetical protein